MSRNNSGTNLRRETSTPNNLTELPQVRDPSGNIMAPTSTTPGIPSRDSSPAIPLSQPPKNRRLSSAKETRREGSPSPARSISSTSIARLAASTASQSSPAIAQTSGNSTATTSQQPPVVNAEQQPLSPRPQRPINPNVPHWPTSPRLSLSRSPPPNARPSSVTSPRRPLDSTLTLPPPSMTVRDRESPGRGRSGDEANEGTSYFHHHTAQRPPRPMASPAPLETVTESSLPSTPAIGMVDKSIDARLHEAEQRRQETSSMSTRPSESSIASSRTTTAQESESDTGNLSDRKPPSRAPSRTVARRSTGGTSSAKAQDPSGEVKGEIETVTSIPQQINPAGTVRLAKKASQETIRPPKKEKRKRQKRVPGSGAQTTKADIFEQRINDTLDDAESSDSEETFVYESNPADKTRPRHSRTNSVTSLSDPRRQALDNTQSRSRRNMKFGTSHVYKGQTNFEDYASDSVGGSSTVRTAGSQSGLRSYIGRGYTNPNTDGGNTPHPGEKLANSLYTKAMQKAMLMRGHHSGTLVVGTAIPSRGPEASTLDIATETTTVDGIGFVFLTTKPLQEVRLINITDVIAAKQEMMFNMDVMALNPNILPVTISTMDVNVFIKSPFVKESKQTKPGDEYDDDSPWDNVVKGSMGPKQERRRRSRKRGQAPLDKKALHALGGVDKGTDPITHNPAEEEEETMLLGRIFNFDSPLVFDGSPFRQDPTHAIGEVRLNRPGNKTEVGGSERWERAMLHTFDLTVRGFLRYQLPLSGRVRTATIQGTVIVDPNDDSAQGFRKHVGSGIDFHNTPN
ncbi:hypothetical protein Dda_4828 [Drechslerella dactyloides]|uniref:Uncharacterized protein n=1 Tax=Drechslerella dactyloides TaxID=74499 RepID=A0AAD6NJL1_DREDA|nr:hypothetical protein Dda_4828 [Drechslerella dactyloides]